DAEKRQISSGDTVGIRSNGDAIALRALVSKSLSPGAVRVAEEHAGQLGVSVEVTKVSSNRSSPEGRGAA
ncbi:MAG: hypothetical protein H0V45_11655, partial [Actinobacteria bacterium]|nr:hypothetical protein [Actinomycetota bacterium]